MNQPGGPEQLRTDHVPDPSPQPDEVLIRVAAAGVNRADLLQRQGLYPPPPGASDTLGLECSGTVVAVGAQVDRWRPGDQVCALLSGGGYAELVAVPEGQVMSLPPGVSLVESAGIPEVAATVVSNLSMVAGLRADEWVLVHGGGSGIGTFAIQYAKALGAKVATTVGSSAKARLCSTLGADVVINYKESDFVTEVREATDGGGADVVLDIIGAKYLEANVRVLAIEGRLVVIGLQGGVQAELNLARLLSIRGSITATSLRARPVAEKARICRMLEEQVWPMIGAGQVAPVIDRLLPLEQAADAHELLASGGAAGKVLLTVNSDQ